MSKQITKKQRDAAKRAEIKRQEIVRKARQAVSDYAEHKGKPQVESHQRTVESKLEHEGV